MTGVRLVVAACVVCLSVAAGAEARLVFEREDGSTVRFSGKPRVTCGPWAEDVARPAIHVVRGDRKRRWELSAVRRDVEPGRPIEFPNAFEFDRPRGAQLFVADRPNEASTAEEESSGSMTFTRAGCRRSGVVAFRIDAVMGSEFSDGGSLRVSGTFRGRVRSP